ncbi:hypothetical protein SPRG_11411 [Saprolegnia parasitica CBS 223.65]|uniref:FYVE-type domain-containing protein n=1 Tax=Saprolegnia parasitica (strain CBS 223.65) TaxID=695850 RepID=A0A067BYX1_SAPPC|nr:hypothetical protein SPRG_11411 [Saprolegnia parasitica CBS 223.65]KDO23488.1 hypothetical protein SPRG_11411 [Saprolegnia parasitica CBS 223.65]|eukprot:XP_012205802.1 hypothetical protein SPRG_11411 [Saprolegnia parasitica CBS 223.65]
MDMSLDDLIKSRQPAKGRPAPSKAKVSPSRANAPLSPTAGADPLTMSLDDLIASKKKKKARESVKAKTIPPVKKQQLAQAHAKQKRRSAVNERRGVAQAPEPPVRRGGRPPRRRPATAMPNWAKHSLEHPTKFEVPKGMNFKISIAMDNVRPVVGMAPPPQRRRSIRRWPILRRPIVAGAPSLASSHPRTANPLPVDEPHVYRGASGYFWPRAAIHAACVDAPPVSFGGATTNGKAVFATTSFHMPLKYSDVLDIVGSAARESGPGVASRTKWPWTFRDYRADMPHEVLLRRGASLVHHVAHECKARNSLEHAGSLDEKVFAKKDSSRNLFSVNAMVEMAGSMPQVLDVLVGKHGDDYASFLARVFRGHLVGTATLRALAVSPDGYVHEKPPLSEAGTSTDAMDDGNTFNHVAAIATAELRETHFFKKVSKELLYMDFMHIQPNERAVTRVFKTIDNESGPMSAMERYKHVLFGYHVERLGRGDRLRISFYGDYCISVQQKQSWKDTKHLLEKLAASVHLVKRICERQHIESALPWTTDDKMDAKKWCHVCHKSFSLFRKRTYCKYCALPVCSDCFKFEPIAMAGGASYEVCICRLCKTTRQARTQSTRASMSSHLSSHHRVSRSSANRHSVGYYDADHDDDDDEHPKSSMMPLPIVPETDPCSLCRQPTTTSATTCRLCRQSCCAHCCRIQQYTNRHGIAFEAWLCLQCLASTTQAVTGPPSHKRDRISVYEKPPAETTTANNNNFTASDFIDTASYAVKHLVANPNPNPNPNSNPNPNPNAPTVQGGSAGRLSTDRANEARYSRHSSTNEPRFQHEPHRLSEQSELRSSFSVDENGFDNTTADGYTFALPMHAEGSNASEDNASVMNTTLHRADDDDDDEEGHPLAATSPIVLNGVAFHTESLLALPKPKPKQASPKHVVSLGAVSNARLLLHDTPSTKKQVASSSVQSNENAVPSVRSTAPSTNVLPRDARSTATNDAQDAIEAETLRVVAFLDMASNDALDSMCHTIATRMDCAYGFVVLIYKGDFVLKGAASGDRSDADAPTQIPRDCILSSHSCQVPLMLPDAEMDPRFAHSPRVLGDERIRFYYGLPLVSPSGVLLGTVAVADTHARVRISSKQHQAMIWFAESTAALIVHRVQTM